MTWCARDSLGGNSSSVHAQLLGASEEIYFRIWETNAAPIIYLNGLLLFVAGLSIVRVHNRWTLRWPLMVTLVGWVAILGGLFRMCASEVQQAAHNAPTPLSLRAWLARLDSS
jgi:hypothetical protein